MVSQSIHDPIALRKRLACQLKSPRQDAACTLSLEACTPGKLKHSVETEVASRLRHSGRISLRRGRPSRQNDRRAPSWDGIVPPGNRAMTHAGHAKPLEDVRDISAITYGFMASKARFAALDFDLFTHIARGNESAAALGQATGIAENRLVTLLAALKSLGLITEDNGRFGNAPATSKFLVAGAPGDFRDYVRLVNGAFGYESFRHLSTALRGERVFPDRGFYEGLIYSAGIGGDQFSSAQHSGSLGPARL